MSRWFRMYDELLDDPKVQRLAADDFRGWVNLLCLASRNDGKLPSIADIAFALRETQDAVSTLLERLRSGGLIERRSGGANGAFDAPYRWAERQYKSDTSTERVKRFRQRSATATETPPETETEADISEPNGSSIVREKIAAVGLCLKAAFPAPGGVPDEIWRDFLQSPKRKKAGMSRTAYAGIENNLRICAEHGFPPGEMIALAVERGWTTVKLEWVQNDDRRTNRMAGHQPDDGLSPTTRAALAVFGSASARQQ